MRSTMNPIKSQYFQVVKDTGWIRDEKMSRPDRGYAVFRRSVDTAARINPAVHTLIEREILKMDYPGNRDLKVVISDESLQISSVWDNSDD